MSGIDLTLNPKVLGVTLLVSVATGVVFGIVPAWIASRTNANAALKQQVRGTTSGRGHHRIRQTLIVVEVALALVLLGGAAVLQRGFDRLLERPGGWDRDRVVIGSLPVPETRIDTDAKRVVLFEALETRLAAIPGVEHAALATSLPLFSYNGDRAVLIQGQTAADANRLPAAFHTMVSSDFFATLGIRLTQGRLFPRGIKSRDAPVVIINEALARRLWPGQNPVGQRLGSMDSGQAYWSEVIGVVHDVDTVASLADPLTPYVVYKPLPQEPWGYVHVVLRAVPGLLRVDNLGDALRRAVASVDPDLVVDNIGSARQLAERQQANVLIAAKLLSGFALLGLALAAVGLYGVIAQLVAQRTPEFGIRIALGAQPRNVLQLVLGHGIRLTSIGILLGVVGAYALARLLGALMPRLARPDPVALGAVALCLFAVAVLACWVHARRATKVDPLIALRAE
jgi:predicted permease